MGAFLGAPCQQRQLRRCVGLPILHPGNALTHSLTHSLTYSLTYLLTHFIQPLNDLYMKVNREFTLITSLKAENSAGSPENENIWIWRSKVLTHLLIYSLTHLTSLTHSRPRPSSARAATWSLCPTARLAGPSYSTRASANLRLNSTRFFTAPSSILPFGAPFPRRDLLP